MSGRDPVDRVIDLAFGVPIAATAFAREATRFAAHAIAGRATKSSAPAASDAVADDGSGAEVVTLVVSEPTTPDLVAVPLDGYDSMSAREILVAVESLDDEALELVEAYELRNRGRRTVLVKVAALRQSTPS